jgi:serine phosphatase RsbU (regulator of sigma subunit)
MNAQSDSQKEKYWTDTINNPHVHDTIKAKTYYRLAVLKMNSSPLVSMHYADKARRLAVKNNLKFVESWALLHLSITNRITGDIKNSIEYVNAAFRIADSLNNSELLANTYHELGLISMAQNDYKKAQEYHFKTISLYKLLKNEQGLAGEYNNLGITYANMGKWDEAAKYFKEALNIELKQGNKSDLGNDYNNIGVVYIIKNSLDSAEFYLKKGLQYRIEANDRLGIAGSYGNFSLLALERNNIPLALEYAKKGYDLAKQLQAVNEEIELLEDYYKIYLKIKDYKSALEYYIKRNELLKSKEYNENFKRMLEMRANLELEKKEKEIIAKDLEIERAGEMEKKKNYILLASVVILLSLVIVVFSVLRSIKRVKAANGIISSQKRKVEDQKKIIEEKHKDITDSINYAKKIQNALILSEGALASRLGNKAFVFFKPRDIVSGDFYWFSEKNGLKLLAVADCTGHGVPGAFMSMIGITLLNQIVNEKGITDTSDILNRLRDGIITSLNQTNEESGKRDGMDIALIAWNENELAFSGANNPCLIVRGNEILEIKPDKQPVGLYEKQSGFLQQNIKLEKNDSIYLFTDGVVDQFGGEKGKKVKLKTFKTWLLEMDVTSGGKQKLESNFNNWKQEAEQVDDVLVIGIKHI